MPLPKDMREAQDIETVNLETSFLAFLPEKTSSSDPRLFIYIPEMEVFEPYPITIPGGVVIPKMIYIKPDKYDIFK